MNKTSLVLSVLALVIVLGFLIVVWPGINLPNGGDSVACTAEALVCPDGSAVGRSGPECEFLACPNQESFTGELIQQGGQFFLAVPAPVEIGGEVTYSLPLEVRVSNVLGQLVGKIVEARGEFKTGNTLVVETMEALSAEAIADKQTVLVGVGETGYAGGVRITLHEIIQDNRCPIDAICIEAGAVTTKVTLESDTDKETRNFPSDEVPYPFDTFKISIIKIEPSLQASVPIDPADYRLTFKVEKLAQN